MSLTLGVILLQPFKSSSLESVLNGSLHCEEFQTIKQDSQFLRRTPLHPSPLARFRWIQERQMQICSDTHHSCAMLHWRLHSWGGINIEKIDSSQRADVEMLQKHTTSDLRTPYFGGTRKIVPDSRLISPRQRQSISPAAAVFFSQQLQR